MAIMMLVGTPVPAAQPGGAGSVVLTLVAAPAPVPTLGEWALAPGGLGPIETTMLVALPELDGAASPTVFAGRHGAAGCAGCDRRCRPEASDRRMAPCDAEGAGR